MSAHRPSKQPHLFASTLLHAIIIVHICPLGRGAALALATHRVAWHGVAGAQSASALHGSSLMTGSQSEQPQIFSSGSAPKPDGDAGDGDDEAGDDEAGAAPASVLVPALALERELAGVTG